VQMAAIDAFGTAFLQERLDKDIILAKHIGIIVDAANDQTVVLRAPLAPNENHKGTAFGGSLYSVAVLAGWAWLTRFLSLNGIAAEAVIQESNIHYLAPVHGELRACLITPSSAEIDKFRRMLERAGRGRIRLRVEIQNHETLATIFDGVFAATLRRKETS
jgi:thioesterase domain-containing protein